LAREIDATVWSGTLLFCARFQSLANAKSYTAESDGGQRLRRTAMSSMEIVSADCST
jgi:hypothetical protein